MDQRFKDEFVVLWKKFFGKAELPITFYYTDEEGHAELVKPGSVYRCVIAAIQHVRHGKPLCFDAESIGCFGGRRYLGFSREVRVNFEYFLSCGIAGKMEGERYKKTPEIAAEAIKHMQPFEAPSKYIVFKRWDQIDESDKPNVVIFFAPPDVLSGLFTLANFDEIEPNSVFAPFGSGCSSIVQYPYFEGKSDRQRAVLGLFDVSARPFVPENTLAFSIPMSKFDRMVHNMDESFLTTKSWKVVQKRIQSKQCLT